MNKNIFQPADILLPKNADMEKWAVIACDQFTSDQAYWDRVRAKAGAVMLAQRTGVPIVPVYLTHDRKPFQPIRCIIGPAYQPAYSAKKISTEEMQRHTDELMARIYQMGAEA